MIDCRCLRCIGISLRLIKQANASYFEIVAQLFLELCTVQSKMAPNSTQTTNNSSPSTSTQSSTEPPAKKQKCLGFRSVTDIQRILECPVCYNTPSNPDQIHFCSNGHMICDGCHQKILEKKCPTCRSEDWNGHHTLLPLMMQILSALPKVCPFSECETQLEDKDREKHVKICQYRSLDCVWLNGYIPCKTKLTFKDGILKHFEEIHKVKKRPNTQGQFEYKMIIKDSYLDGKFASVN